MRTSSRTVLGSRSRQAPQSPPEALAFEQDQEVDGFDTPRPDEDQQSFLQPEPATLGVAAITFTTNDELPGVKLTPEPGEMRAFVDEYSAFRRKPLTRHQREQIAAWATFVAAYTARCEHALKRTVDNANGFAAALRNHGTEYLEP